MNELRSFWKFFVIFFMITEIYASINPLKNPHICGRPICEEKGDKNFKYNLQNIYRYDYKMHIRTEFSGSGQNTSDLFLKGHVELLFPKNCEGILRLNSFELHEQVIVDPSSNENDYDSNKNDNHYDDNHHDYNSNDEPETHPNSAKLAEDIERYDLRFSFHDGLIAETCPDLDEPVWVLNFKKGILSAFQNTMLRFDMDYNTTEVDVSGSCDVTYVLSGSKETSLLIQKNKNLQSCRYRYHMDSILQTTPYEFRQNYAAWPILKSDSYCDISIDHNIYNFVQCHERHQLVPFSNDNHGAVTESTITLTLTEEDKMEKNDDDENIPIEKRTSLLFDHTPSPRLPHGEIKTSRDLLKQMCSLGFPDIQRGFPEVFQSFLLSAKLLSFDALQQLLLRAPQICDNGKNHILESLPYIGSQASVQLMKEQIVKNEISTLVAESWMSSLSFMKRPDGNMLEAMFSLMEYGKAKDLHSFTLGASAVAHTFCRHNENCIENTEIETIVKYLEQDIEEYITKPKARQSRERVIVSLKALGNIGVISENYDKQLISIIQDETLSLEIRLQAINAFRRLDCEIYKNFFIGIYRNFTAQPEVRIASYLQAMKCPDYLSINSIKFVLQTEEVNQVGSFVWSHLNNIAQSASPVRVFTQGLLVGSDLNDKYKLDVRKFSRSFEYSTFFDEYNFGANAESNLIFGTDSYLPRTLSLNLTFDLFGESVNILEMNTRMQGFDKFFESYFGPKGPINAKRFMKKYDDLSTFIKGLIDGENLPSLSDLSELNDPTNLIEIAKDIKHDLTEFEEEDEYSDEETQDRINQKNSLLKKNLEERVDGIGYDLKYKHNAPRASLGVKVFGNDLQYHTIEGLEEVFLAASRLNPASITDFLSSKEISYTKSGIVLDAEYSVPMSSGLPLSLNALGTSSVDVRVSGLWNNPGFKKTQKLDVTAKIKPSVSVDVLTSMKCDFFHGTSGIRVQSNLYSSSSVEAKLKVRGAKLISLHVSLPQDRNEIFSAKSELLVIKHDKDIVQDGIARRYENSSCTWPVVDMALGLKLCADYKLPDVSKSTDYPSLILSGPVTLDIHLDKADLTAKTFVFEYRSDKNKFGSQKSFIFETPGSEILRRILANITSDHEKYNTVMTFEHGDIKHSAVGSYKDSDLDKRLEFSLDLNNDQYFALEMGMNKTNIRNGAIFYPRFFLIVQQEKIAGLTGAIRKMDKNDKLQYDVMLIFETKKLQSKLNGYLTRTEASYTTKLTLDYRFSDTKSEQIDIEAEFSDRSNKGQTKLLGNFKHQSTAYPKYNFVSNVQLLTALGHIEIKFDINNAPDLQDPAHNLGIKLTLARHLEYMYGRTKFSIEATRPKSNTDVKFLIKHDQMMKNGTENNYLVVLRYAPKREAIGVVSIYEPLGQLYAIDITSNITVPGFDPCTLAVGITETKRKDFILNLKGEWFSGHALGIKGTYQDRSSYIKSFHHLKVLITSPSFLDTTADLRYSRDKREFKIDAQVEYGNDPYGIILKNVEEEDNNLSAYGEFKWKDQLYWISSNMMYSQPKQLVIEIHVDKERDIHLILRGVSNSERKEAGIEIKWNANRDPTQKLALSVEFNTPHPKVYNGGFFATYPNRTFSGQYDLFLRGPEYHGDSRVAWSLNEVIEFSFGSGTRMSDVKNVWLWAKLNTPFEGWTTNDLNSGIYYMNKLLRVNASILWAETQNIAVEFSGEYDLTAERLDFEVKTGLNSTLKDVPGLSAHIKHNQNSSRVNTDITFKKSPFNDEIQLFSVKSAWQIQKDSFYKNVSGSVGLKTPYEGYKTGALVTKFSLNDFKELIGGADFELETKKFTLVVDGHIKKLTDCMLMINITTPIEKFRYIVGRFGINDREKHVVAEIRGPEQALGAEVLFSIISSSDFDIKFSLETPLEAFEKILLIAKMKPKTVDFRGGFNKFLLGFVGVWRFSEYQDFEYSYKVYTPLQNFEENGVVARLIRGRSFDFEMTIKLAQYKLGALVLGQPKPELLNTLQLDAPFKVYSDLFKDELPRNINDYDYDDDDMDDDFENDSMSFTVYMEFDVVVIPTIKGDLRLAEVDSTFLCVATIELPHGIVEINDRFYYPDILAIKNELLIKTPYGFVKEIKSVFQSSIDIFKAYTAGFDLAIYNESNWIESGFFFKLTNSTDESDLHINNVVLNIKTPLQNLPRLNLTIIIETEDNLWRANFTGNTLYTVLSLAGALENDINFVDSTVGFSLSTPLVPSYACKVFLKKDYSDVENSVDFGFELNDNGVENRFRMETMWHIDNPRYLNAKAKFNTNLLPLKFFETAVLLTRAPSTSALLELSYVDQSDDIVLFKVGASRKKEVVNFELITPMPDFKNVSVVAYLTEDGDTFGNYKLTGNLYRNTELYQLSGSATILEDIPRKMDITIKPTDSRSPGAFSYTLDDTTSGKKLSMRIFRGDRYAQLHGNFDLHSRLSWNYNLNVKSSEPQIREIIFSAKSQEIGDHIDGSYSLKTPWKDLGIDSIKLNTEVKILSYSGEATCNYELPHVQSDGKMTWSWLPGEDMHVSLVSHTDRQGLPHKMFEAGAKYLNPGLTFAKTLVGAHIDVNSIWKIGSNGSLSFLKGGESVATIIFVLPEPAAETHHIDGRYRGSSTKRGDSEEHDYAFTIQYAADLAQTKYAVRGQYGDGTDLEGMLRLEWGSDKSQGAEAIIQMLRKGIRREILSRIITPVYPEDTFLLTANYDIEDIYKRYIVDIYIPESKRVANADISFSSLINTKGNLNCTTPFLNVTWMKCDFDFTTNSDLATKFIKASWPNDMATFESKQTTLRSDENIDLDGVIEIEVPVQTRHFIRINYNVNERPSVKIGNTSVIYNENNVLNGNYKFKSVISNEIKTDIYDIALKNTWRPIGIHYVHTLDEKEKKRFIYDIKHVEIFEIENSDIFNITTELHNRTTETGQEFILTAIHPNRTVILSTNYDYQSSSTKQKSKIELGPNVWVAYDYNSRNITTDDIESHIFSLDLSYPKRNLTANGFYTASDHSLDSNIEFKWGINNFMEQTDYDYDDNIVEEPRVMSARVAWNKDPTLTGDELKHSFGLELLHPSFEKNVTFKGTYYKGLSYVFKTDVEIEYCDEPDHLFTFGVNLEDLSMDNNRNYTINVKSSHNDTSLLLDATASILLSTGLYKTSNTALYKRSYLPLQDGVFFGLLDIIDKELHYYKRSSKRIDRIWIKADGGYPIYTMNGTYEDSLDEIDSSGQFYLNIDDKFIKLDVNLTPDATQNLKMLGFIPDARSASFEIWRNYEDIHVSDISYYLKMNHSRLVTSKLKWRPQIKAEIKAKIRDKAQAFYEGLAEGLDFWKKSISIEIVDAYHDILRSSKPYTENFLKDFGDLSVIQQDLDELHEFLNESYQANDFYIHSVVNFSLTILNELAIKDHITSVPKIFGEIIQSMGDSGTALKEAIDLLIETIKNTYHKAVEMIGKILHGDSFENLSTLLEEAVGKYDKWIKDLHITLMKHVENIYTKVTQAIASSWKRLLQNIEPSLITFVHYVETVMWGLTKEVYEFLYQRSTELAGSPYFNQVSSFTKDLDHFYRDIMRNDAITNIKKYSGVVWEFVKDKYFKLVPFGKELHEILNELYEELKTLQTLEPIQFIMKKYHEFELQMQWFADEFKIEKRLQQIWILLRKKVARFAQTALQSDSQYREAKTKFIFDPDTGVLELEQKLPMSWHAFNETPKFEEIPEYKLIHDSQDFLAGSNETIWSFYHDLRPLLEPTTWLPPFKSHAYLLASRHYVTFDKKYVSLDLKYEVIEEGQKPNQCSYLLAKDYFNSNFTLVIEPTTIVNKQNEIISSRRYSLLIQEDIIMIGVVGDTLQIGTNITSILPVRIKDIIIQRDSDILTITSANGFEIRCNIQFDYCSVELSGWYFGKTAGLLGTMNNEPYDEYLTSSNTIAQSDQEFVSSWALPGCNAPIQISNYTEVVENATTELIKLCDSYFKNKFSFFGTCFPLINPKPFYEMCLDLGINSMSNVLYDDHPSVRGVCTAALAYLDMCNEAKMPLRVPDICVHCDLINGSYVPEGKFLKVEGDDIVNTSDIVFLIEAKPCNENFTNSKSLLTVAAAISKELEDMNITNNRYSVMAFGGKSPFDEPRTVVYNSKVFTTDHRELIHYFNHIKISDGKNNDIFHAIVAASKLIFRPGASKTFILVPCSECLADEMRLDYSAVLQLLLENGINLHVLMDSDFVFDKLRLNKLFFGIDNEFAYSKKDLNHLQGDAESRKQIRLPKQSLGVCAPLAIETNGSVFTAKKLKPDKKNPVKKVSTVFAKRVAKTAFPNKCQTCECTGHNTGVAYMICYPCIYPVPLNADYFEIDSDEIGPWNWEEDEGDVGFMGKDFN